LDRNLGEPGRLKQSGARRRARPGLEPTQLSFEYAKEEEDSGAYKKRKRPPTEAALLCLVGVKGGLLGLQIGDQFFDPIKCLLIGDPGRRVLVVLDLDVESDTIVTHFPVPHSRENAVVIGCCLYDDEAAKMFSSILEAIGRWPTPVCRQTVLSGGHPAKAPNRARQ
jgi:hypothetical protein